MKNLNSLKVAKILDEYRIVLNAGSEDNVTVGMSFVIFNYGDEIVDPDDGSHLGKLEITKGRVKVEYIQEKFCTAKSDIVTTHRHATTGRTFTRTKELEDVKVGDHAKRVA
ncbi:hypothetical protein [uncultured Caulobacter sp.]|uniref:hypothetical protein n=1 Tax=uncultured Caulobacter sp. TaxID=158749 RepID=UPI00261A1484|nr:hypothetical protein [uncultured Caulobacter sp.]